MMPQASFPVPLTSRWYYRGPACRIVPLTEPGLWVPLSCAIAIADSGNAHVTQAGFGTSGAINATGATLLVGVTCGAGAASIPSDSQFNTWSALTSQNGSFSGFTDIVYVANPTVSGSQTFTLAASPSSTPSGCFVALTGVATVSPFDGQQNGASAVSSPAQPGAVTPVNASSLIVSGLGGTVSSIASVTGMTLLDSVAVIGGVAFSSALAYVIQVGGPSAVNPTWTYTDASGTDGIVIGCFEPGGVSGVLLNLLH
jgi:hypothetical protein